mmetsp:Transcript_36406/g.51462  ORF Transcript_36406/g.51462 Transcript_36406/m.51462 type:complete len:188 (+) Transcript_36406:102-665(+)
MRQSSTFTTEEEGLQNDDRLRTQFAKNLKELAKICFLTLLSFDSSLSKDDVNTYAQATLIRTLQGLTDTKILTSLQSTHEDLKKLATIVLPTEEQSDFQLHTTVNSLLVAPEDITDEHFTAKVSIELVSTILLHLAPFLTRTPLEEKHHQIQQLKLKKDIKAYLKNRETTKTTEKIDAERLQHLKVK